MVGPDRGAPRGMEPQSRTPVGVLICDDHEVLRQGLRTVLRRTPDLVVVAEAADAGHALALAESLHAAVTLVGLGGRGVVVQNLVAALAGMGVRVVLLGEAGAGGDPVDALRAGARGFMRTAVSPERLVEGVRSVAQGETVLDAAVAGELLQHLEAPRLDAVGAAGRGNPLTGRQEAVSELVAEGLTNAEIAD